LAEVTLRQMISCSINYILIGTKHVEAERYSLENDCVVFTPKWESLIILGFSRIGGKLKKIIAAHDLEDGTLDGFGVGGGGG
jgi:hypothetical protein